jgi:hypothetical protein
VRRRFRGESCETTEKAEDDEDDATLPDRTLAASPPLEPATDPESSYISSSAMSLIALAVACLIVSIELVRFSLP